MGTEVPIRLDRYGRQRAQTRSRLLGAARELVSERGVEAMRISDITDRADVGFGSFYNHFADKDAIVQELLLQITEEHGAIVDKLTEGLADPAEVVSVAHRHFVRLAVSEPSWGRLMLALDPVHDVLGATLASRARRDLEGGIESYRFFVGDIDLLLTTIGGALLGAIRAVVARPASRPAPDEQHAETILRMLGLPAAEAEEIARRPMPGS